MEQGWSRGCRGIPSKAERRAEAKAKVGEDVWRMRATPRSCRGTCMVRHMWQHDWMQLR